MRNLAWTPVLLALALTGCPDKDTGETDPGTDTETGTDPDTDTDSDTEADTDPPGPQAGDEVYFEGFETDGTAFPDGWTTSTADGSNGEIMWKLCETGVDCDGNSGAQLNLAEGSYYAAIDADGDGSSGLPDGELYQGTLTSPAIDLSEYGDFSLVMSLDQFYRDIGDAFSDSDDAASIEVSSDGGTTWVIVQDYPAIDTDTERANNSSSNGPCPSFYDMSAYAGETIQLRFNYTAGWDWWYMVDNLSMVLADAAPTLPTPDAWTCPVEVCDDATDNDLDQFADCADADCAEDAACTDVCVGDSITLPATGQGTTPADMTSNLDWASGPDCTTGAGSELVFTVDAEAGDVIKVSENNSAFDATVRILDGCTAGTATCLASVDSGDTATYTVETAGTFTVVIEGYGATESDDFDYTIGLNPADAEDCATAGDEDLDGDADCADSECADEAQCQEVCDSGMDEDADGLTDCDDIDDCFDTVECPYTCPADTPVAFTDGVFTASGDYADLEALPYNDGEGCGFAAGPGQIWQVALEAGQQIRFEETGSADTVVRVLDACAPGNACLDSSDTPENIRYQAGDTAETVYFVMEAYFSSTTSGEWGVTATLIPNEDCSTDVDEDDDGDIACDDSDCAMDVACFELDCADGASGDDDELIDCMDPDCDDSVDCVELDCTDGEDNDMDGDIDCADTQCIGTAACPEVDCDDGADNDDDNAIDCDDSDCADAEVCFVCPDPEASLPLTVSGDDWDADNDQLFGYTDDDNGCEDAGTSDGTEALYAVNALAGDTISVNELSGGVDFIVNITSEEAGCVPAQNEQVCLYSADNSGTSETFNYVAEADGVYYVHVGSYFNTDSDDYEYELNVTSPEQCDTDVDEDEDGAVGCDDSDCFDDFDTCPFECPAALSVSDFPLVISGSNWSGENRDVYDFDEVNGCEGGSGGGGGDYVFAIQMSTGDTLDFTDTGSVDHILNVTQGSCEPTATTPDVNTCVFGADDSDNYEFTAPADGLYYVTLSSYAGTNSSSFTQTVEYVAAP